VEPAAVTAVPAAATDVPAPAVSAASADSGSVAGANVEPAAVTTVPAAVTTVPAAATDVPAPVPAASAAISAPVSSPVSGGDARMEYRPSTRSSAAAPSEHQIGEKGSRSQDEPNDLFVARNKGAARKHHQIHFGEGLPNPIFDQVYLSPLPHLKSVSHSSQENNCFKNSIALLMRLHHVPTSLKLQSPNLSLSGISTILNQGGHYLRKLPLYFEENRKKLFKPEMPTLLAVFLQIKFGVDLPWLHDPALDFSKVAECVSRVSAFTDDNALPYLILNPFNNTGVPLHCVGLECRWNKAIVWDPANVNSFEFSLDTLHALCDGKWTPSFRRIWCIYARASSNQQQQLMGGGHAPGW
jgi:hypothetical protein